MRANFYRIVLPIVFPALAAAQLPNASPAAAALGAYTAQARGFDAVAWNPANLGMPGNPLLSLGIGVLNTGTGLKPISLNDISPYYGKPTSDAIRKSWLQSVTANGGETGSVDGALTPVALSIGPLAIQAGTQMIGSLNLSPGVVEAMLFGNEGFDSTVHTVKVAGSSINVGAFTTGAVSYGLSLPSAPLTHMAVGVTGKYVVGNFLARGIDNGSTLGDSITAAFPMILSMGLPTASDSNGKINPIAGKGFGLDVGFAWSNPVFTIGAAVQNAMNTFAWDTTQLSTRTVNGSISTTSQNKPSTSKTAFGTAPQSLRDSVTMAKFKPAVNVGIAMALDHNTTLVADARQQIGNGITNDAKTTLAGGVEWRGIPFIALRGGAAYLTNGWGASGGFGIHLGPYELGLAGAVRSQSGGRHGALTLSALTIH